MSEALICAPVIQCLRGSLHDGPGVRTVVYLKGCNLACAWCHNPESHSFKREIVFHKSKCIGCGRCGSVCPVSAHGEEISENGEARHVYIRDNCTACGKCANACPSEALTVCGDAKTPEEVFSEIQRDMHYYRMGGGVTFSGGECLLHPDFLEKCLGMCKSAGIHTAVETALHVPCETVQRLMGHIDLFIVDIKHMDTAEHWRYTGVGNERILENIRRLAADGAQLIIRTPLIPGVNDSRENLLKTAGFIVELGRDGICMELLKYNNLGVSKYESLGRSGISFADSAQDNSDMDELCEYINGFVGYNLASYRK